MKYKLSEICNIINGYAFKSSEYVDKGIRIIRITNVQKGFIDDTSPQYYPVERENEIIPYMLKEDDLLISLTGNVGRVGLLTSELLPAALNQRVACLRIKDISKIKKKYLFYALNNILFEDRCIFSAKGIAQKNMSTAWLGAYEIHVPSMTAQSYICEVLSRVDELLSLHNKQLLLLENLIKSRFIEMFGDININTKNWPIKPLGELCDIYRGGSPRPINKFLGGDVPWIKIGDATQGDEIYLHSTKEHIIKDGVKKSRMVKSGSLIFANCGVSLGFARIITFDGCIHDGWLAFEDVDESLDKVFLLLSLNQLTEYFRAIAPDGTQPNLNTAIMKMHQQIIPPIKLQRQFVEFVRQVDKSKLSIQQSIETLQTLKAKLMQDYFG